MAKSTNKDTNEVVNEVATEKVEIDKTILDKILADNEEMKAEILKIKKDSESASKIVSTEQRKIAEEQRLIELTKAANAEAAEEVEAYLDLGAIKSNKNIEMSINGKQYIIPKGQKVMIPKAVKEGIENSKIQQSFAFGVQRKYADEANKAEKAGRI